MQLAFDQNCEFTSFVVLNWNPAQNLYKSKGAIDLTELEGWNMYRFNYESLNYINKNSNLEFSNRLSKHYVIREANFLDLKEIDILNLVTHQS